MTRFCLKSLFHDEMEFTQEFKDRMALWKELFPPNPIVTISGGKVVGT